MELALSSPSLAPLLERRRRETSGAAFVAHIQAHLKNGEFVICKICGKSVDEISALDAQYREALEHIRDYWNGDHNEMAMVDALEFIGEKTNNTLSSPASVAALERRRAERGVIEAVKVAQRGNFQGPGAMIQLDGKLAALARLEGKEGT